MIVKICGIKTMEIAQIASDSGADLLGFVFAPSKRQITPKDAAQIAQNLPHSVLKVGVFVNETAESIIQIADEVGLNIIQLHGEETPDILPKLGYPTIKAFPIDGITRTNVRAFPSNYTLVDSPKGRYHGGTGQPFNWNLATHLAQEQDKLILAGGLTPDNVNEAIRIVQPYGVDVSSGVETNGKKDSHKIKQFIKNVKGCLN
ncbi:MAG TPA: phosphoribosylanthranilate isomerase [Virgibacillus sp.]|nr:phosphoribosylanthranilate isomerase [Virgibacillus sp.]